MKTEKGLTPEEIRKNSHWRKVMNTTYLNGDEIDKGDTVVTIKAYKEQMIYSQKDKQKEPQVLLYFAEIDKPMILTNRKAKQITNSLETEFMVDWIGKKVTMYAVKETHFGETFEVITFKKAVIKKDVLNENSPRWKAACDALKAGATTIEAIEKHYSITNVVRTQLKKIAEAEVAKDEAEAGAKDESKE